MITVGIDPGLTGAIGVLNEGCFLEVIDMPVVAKGTGSVKNEVDPAGISDFLKNWQYCEIRIGIERVNAMPKQGSSSTFSLGDSFGSARAAVSVTGFPLAYVAPAHWKRYFKLPSDKEASRALAVRMFPTAPLHLKKHADRAEALLIARWLYETAK